MRKIYLIRHSQPNFPDEKKMCIGKTDLPLSALGRMQSVLLAEGLKEKKISKVFCSPLRRSRETASYLCAEIVEKSGLAEFDCGEWDGYSFDEIKKCWPEIYELRGIDLSYPIPGAEPLEEGMKRFEKAMLESLVESDGDIAIVGHATANKTFLCPLYGIEPKFHRQIPMDYASVTTLCWDGKFSVEKQNEVFVPDLSEELCKRLLMAVKTPEHVQKHCVAVKDQAIKICQALKDANVELNEELLAASALLHDIARTEKRHDTAGAEWMKNLGYENIAQVIAGHHDGNINIEEIDEKAVLIMADRTVRETEVVSVEDRFLNSREKCKTEEALRMHEQRYVQTIALKEKINTICGKEIIL